MIINAHVHVHRYGKDFSEKLGILYEQLWRNMPNWRTGKPWTRHDYCLPLKTLLDDMDRFGISKSWISGYVMIPAGCYDPELADYMASLQNQAPDRIVGTVNVDPLGGDKSAKEIERAITKLGLKMVKELLPQYNHCATNDKRIWPIYEATQALGVPINIHYGWSGMLTGKTQDYGHPMQLEDICLDFPDLKIICAHMGFLWAQECMTVMYRFPNVWCDISFWMPAYPIHWCAQNLVYAKSLGLIDRVMWGNDYPYADPAKDLEKVRRIPEYTRKYGLEPNLTDEDIAGILGGNAARFLPNG